MKFTARENAALLKELWLKAALRKAISPGQPEPLVTAVAKLEERDPGPAGRASREQQIEAALAWMPALHADITQDRREIAAEIVDALGRLSPSGEGEEREGADGGLHGRGLGRDESPGSSPSRSGPATLEARALTVAAEALYEWRWAEAPPDDIARRGYRTWAAVAIRAYLDAAQAEPLAGGAPNQEQAGGPPTP